MSTSVVNDKVKVTINNTVYEYPVNTTLLEISKDFQKDYDHDIILAFVNNKLRELFKTVKKDCTIRFVTVTEDAGHKTYVRGMILVMLKAFYSEFGAENVEKVSVEYSISNGLYCDYSGSVPLTEQRIQAVKNRMIDLVKKDIPFIKRSIGTDDAIELFHHYRMYDKERLFRYRRVSKANIYNLDGFEDYYYGYMPPSTGIQYFDLNVYDRIFITLTGKKEADRSTSLSTATKTFSYIKRIKTVEDDGTTQCWYIK